MKARGRMVQMVQCPPYHHCRLLYELLYTILFCYIDSCAGRCICPPEHSAQVVLGDGAWAYTLGAVMVYMHN